VIKGWELVQDSASKEITMFKKVPLIIKQGQKKTLIPFINLEGMMEAQIISETGLSTKILGKRDEHQ
jgi:hypothetical protein